MKHGYIRNIIFLLGSLFVCLSSIAYAGIPVWNFTPLTPTSIFLTPSNTATVQYLVSNNAKRAHTLEMLPIVGISQITTGLGICGNPFTLNPKGTVGSSCTLSLQVSGSLLTSSVDDGPDVCIRGSRLQCYRPALPDVLHITRSSGSSFTVGGNLSGLSGTVTLQNNGSDNLSLSSNGSFVFSTPLAAGNAYNVTVVAQPANQNCTVTNGTGIITNTNVTNVSVTCATSLWTWMSGANTVNQNGTYGTITVPDPSNIAGARYSSTSWVDSSGNFWLFGGFGIASSSFGYLNDLWLFNANTQIWTWMKGPNTVNQYGVYNTQGVPNPSSVPGSRRGAISWTAGDNLWLFGGFGRDFTSLPAPLSDLWQYNTISGNWTWISGPNVNNQVGNYGTQGVPNIANIPGGRQQPVSWIDNAGNLWLFGGFGYASTFTQGNLNDVWKFDVNTSEWTWMKGSNTVGSLGTYGTKGVPAVGNNPGARTLSVSWVDNNGNYWLFGGNGFDSVGTLGDLNDLWMYNIGTNQWTWVSGSDLVDQVGIYGTLGVTSSLNIPGSREASISWTDQNGAFWLFGGLGYGINTSKGRLNDLWKYDPMTNQWTWISGSNTVEQAGVYGTLGVPNASNMPGSRSDSISWLDLTGNLWLFGGWDTNLDLYNDVWRYTLN